MIKAELEITNEVGIVHIDEMFRIIDCPKCQTFNMDRINLNKSADRTELEPYAIKLREVAENG